MGSAAAMSDIRIHRSQRRASYTVVDNRILNHDGLSLEAKGLLCCLLAKPDDWTISLVQLSRALAVGRDKLNRIMTELRNAGYARLVATRDGATGRMQGSMWEIDEAPGDGSREREGSDDAEAGGEDPPAGDAHHRGPEKPALGEPAEALKNRLSEKPSVGKSGPIPITIDSQITESDQVSPPLTPRIPSEGERASPNFEARDERRNAAEDDERSWAAFNRVWDWAPRELPGTAREVFLTLSPEDRAAAVRYAPRYLEAAAGKMRTFAHNWLRGRNWTHFVEQDAAAAEKQDRVRAAQVEQDARERAKYGGVVIYPDRESGRQQHAAWRRHDAAIGVDYRRDLKSFPCGQGYVRPSRFPPGRSESVPPSAEAGPAHLPPSAEAGRREAPS
jgi:hypothetical protein